MSAQAYVPPAWSGNRGLDQALVAQSHGSTRAVGAAAASGGGRFGPGVTACTAFARSCRCARLVSVYRPRRCTCGAWSNMRPASAANPSHYLQGIDRRLPARQQGKGARGAQILGVAEPRAPRPSDLDIAASFPGLHRHAGTTRLLASGFWRFQPAWKAPQ